MTTALVSCRERGEVRTEYIIIAAVVVLAALTIFGLFGNSIRTPKNAAFENQSEDLQKQQVAPEVSKDTLVETNQESSSK